MRRAWLFVGCLAGCSTIAPLDETGSEATGGGPGSTGSSDSVGTGSGTLPPSETSNEVGSEAQPTGGGDSGTTIDVDVATEGTTVATSLTTATTVSEETGGESTGGDPGVGCGGEPVAAGAQDRMLVVDGVDRHYIVVVPPNYDPNTSYPLVFAWHGSGGSGMLARQYFGIEEASAGAAIFVYADGLPLPDMMNQTGWNLNEDGEDVEFFDAMLADLQATLCVDDARVFSAGHSFGGFMSNALGCFRGGTIRAIAPVAGGGPFGACTGQVAAWIAHGTLDEVVNFTFGEMSRDLWAAANGCDTSMASDVDPAPCVAYAGCDAGYPVHWCQHDIPDFSGHTWPAWAGAGIWGFFAAL